MKGGAGGGEGAKEAGVTDKQSVIRMGLSCRTACPLEVSHSELPAFLWDSLTAANRGWKISSYWLADSCHQHHGGASLWKYKPVQLGKEKNKRQVH